MRCHPPIGRVPAAVAGLAAALLLGCGSSTSAALDAAGPSADASSADAASADANPAAGKPNVIFILTDDLAWNLVAYMPHVQAMQQRGMTFSRYFVTDSLCCPSRASIFTGKFPHDTLVFTNTGANGGYAQFERVGNATQTFANVVHSAGYRTAMMGKYLNGYDPQANQADPGWNQWDVAGNAYSEYGYQLNQDGVLQSYGHTRADYLVDVQSGLARAFVDPDQGHGGEPFLLEVATFAPHAPYTPAARYLGTMHEVVPRTPAYDQLNVNPPQWLAAHPALTPAQLDDLDMSFNLRAEAVRGVDDLIGALMDELVAKGLDRNTYLVFSSDNGYHMGDHMLMAGKMTAFDTDINVPLIVMGPGVPAGVTVDRIVENIDLCPTFAELAGTPPPPATDGHSLVPLLMGQPITEWRDMALIEHRGPDLEPMDPNDPDHEPTVGPEPNSYEAIRMASSLYVKYRGGEIEYYDLASDPFELTNTAATLPMMQVTQLQDALTAAKTCHGAPACWAAQKL